MPIYVSAMYENTQLDANRVLCEGSTSEHSGLVNPYLWSILIVEFDELSSGSSSGRFPDSKFNFFLHKAHLSR